MKAKLFALLVLFFALSLAAWSYVPDRTVETDAELATPDWPELPRCAGRDTGDASHSQKASNGQALNRQDNPIETAFIEATCLLASN